MQRFLLLSFGLIVLSCSSYAQQKAKPAGEVAKPKAEAAKPTPQRELTLKDAIELGIKTSPVLMKAASEKEAAEATFDKYKGGLFPTVELQATSDTSKGAEAMSAKPDEVHSKKTYTTSAVVTQPLFTSGKMLGGLRLGRAIEDKAEQNYFLTRQTLIREVVEAFYNLSSAHDRLVAAEENHSILNSYAKISKRYESIGRTRNIDRIQADVNVSLGRFEILDAQTARENAEAALKKLLSLEAEKAIHPKFDIKVQPIAKITVDEALATAEKNNPELRQLRIELDRVKAANQIDLSSDLPSLELKGIVGYQSPDREQLFKDNSDFYTVGLTLKVPFFSGLSSFAKRREHKATYFQAERDLQIKGKEIREQLEVNLNNANRLYTQLLEVQGIVKETRRALDLANQGYSRGVVQPVDILQFQRSRFDAEKRFISIQYDYLLAVLKVRELLGTDLERVYAQ